MAVFFTTTEVADKLGISVYTLRKYLQLGWVKAGRLPGGTVYRFSQKQVSDAMACFEGGGGHEDSETDVKPGVAVR